MISFFTEDLSFELSKQKIHVAWLEDSISREGKELGEISYVFCSDDYLHKMNVKHLNHDTFTDIITFNYCENNTLSADIFISIDRVKENAKDFDAAFIDELDRVMIHGVLHLMGYDDKAEEEKKEMRSKEDFYLSLRSNK